MQAISRSSGIDCAALADGDGAKSLGGNLFDQAAFDGVNARGADTSNGLFQYSRAMLT